MQHSFELEGCMSCQRKLIWPDAGFFRTRWERATAAERDCLRAMVEDGNGPQRSGAVAELMRRKVGSLGPARANLSANGLIYAPEHGKIAFTVPGMADFIGRQSGE